jgi:predicted regulator of Ras-like GTPase activity (Roadblock/LC7/MglB family)
MKNLYKIITLFAIIFVAGIFLTVITVNSSLNKFETEEKTVEIQRDTVYLLKAEKKTVLIILYIF